MRESVRGSAGVAAATWTADGKAWNRCCGLDDCRGLKRPDALVDAIDGPRVGFELGFDAKRGSGCTGRGVTLVDCDALGTGCARVTGVPGLANAFATWDGNAFWPAIGEGSFASGSARASFGADAALTAGAAMGVAVE